MARPAIIYNRMGGTQLAESRNTRSGIVESRQTYEIDCRYDRKVYPASVSTPVESPRAPTDFNSFSYSGGTYALGHHEDVYVNSDFIQGRYRINTMAPHAEVDFSDDITGVTSRALNGALLKLLDQDINLGVALGEYKETAELFQSTAKTIATGFKTIRNSTDPASWQFLKKELSNWWDPRRGSRSEYYRRLGRKPQYARGAGVVDRWLEQQYAVKPFLQDMYGAVEALRKNWNDEYKRTVIVKKSSKDSVRRQQVAYDIQDDGFAVGLWNVQVDLIGFCKLEYTLDDPIEQTLAQLGIYDPLPVAFELIPFSFVLDWFYPVGDFLLARKADTGFKFLRGSLSNTAKMRARTRAVEYDLEVSSGFVRRGVVLPVGATGHRFQRTVFTQSPTPMPPVLKNPLSLGHVANGLSLLVSVLK